MRIRTPVILALFLLAPCRTGVAADEKAPAPTGSCVEQVVHKVACSNPADVCRLLFKGRSPRRGANLDAIFDFREQNLGDGTEAYVFSHRGGGDRYAYLPNLHFVKQGDRLVLMFDGEGVPANYATDRSKVNGRYQIERISVADIPGLYRKRETETWFWNGEKYVKAYSRVTIDSAKDPRLNGTQMVWAPETEQAYRSAGPSWTYTVKGGDTLGAIAKRFGVSSAEIMSQNGIRSAGSLRIGQVLRYEGWKVNAR